MGWKRVDALNDDSIFVQAMADMVKNHLERNETASAQWYLQCPQCTFDSCGETRDFFFKNNNELKC
jgi:ferrochelatase